MTTADANLLAAGAPPAPTVIRLSGVSKRFVIRKDNSLKERLVTLGRAGRRHSEDFWALRGLTLSSGPVRPSGSSATTARARARS